MATEAEGKADAFQRDVLCNPVISSSLSAVCQGAGESRAQQQRMIEGALRVAFICGELEGAKNFAERLVNVR